MSDPHYIVRMWCDMHRWLVAWGRQGGSTIARIPADRASSLCSCLGL